MFLLRMLMRRFEGLVRSRSARIYWTIVILLGVITLGSGAMGWIDWKPGPNGLTPRPSEEQGLLGWLDAIQRGGKALFSSELYLDPDVHDTPLLLLLARFCGSAFFLILAGRFIIFALGGRVARAFVWARAGHDVVVGDHEAAHSYVDAVECQVTYISDAADSRYDRVATLHRSHSLKTDLTRAAAKRARRIIVAERTDNETWAVAQKVAAAQPDLEIIAHIEDPWLLERISRADPDARIRPFSYASGAARHLMLAHPPFLLARAYQAPGQHIVIVGFGAMGQALLREFMVTSVSINPAPMMVTVVDPDAARLSAEFRARHPGLEPYVNVAFMAGRLTSQSDKLEGFFAKRCETCRPCAVYIAIGNDDHPLREAVGVKDRAERLGWFTAPIFVQTASGSGLKKVRPGIGCIGGRADTGNARWTMLRDLALVPFGDWHDALDGADLLSGQFDYQARMFHDAYQAAQQANAPKNGVAGQEWRRLDEEFRISNRRTAAHIRSKLDAAGYDLNTWLEAGRRDGAPHAATDLPPAAEALDLDDIAELDRLGELEHLRWSIDRTMNGWKYGPERDNAARTHPDLVPNRDLDEAARQKDRDNVREAAQIILRITADAR